MSRKIYRTEGRERLIGFLSEHPDCQFTVDELCLQVNGGQENGRSSIYRQLSELCARDAVRKYRDHERACSVYQYVGAACDCRDHFHAKCLKCGKIEHLECGDSSEFARHLQSEHGFAIDCGQSVLYGVCAACKDYLGEGPV